MIIRVYTQKGVTLSGQFLLLVYGAKSSVVVTARGGCGRGSGGWKIRLALIISPLNIEALGKTPQIVRITFGNL